MPPTTPAAASRSTIESRWQTPSPALGRHAHPPRRPHLRRRLWRRGLGGAAAAVDAANAQPRNALGVGLSAVHVHHGLRGDEADADLAFVQSLCLRLEVPLHIRYASVPGRVAHAREAGQSETVEEAARNLRYDHFRRLIAEGHADSVLTAHTLDDQAETVLMKLLRGAWTEGLSGIHPCLLVESSPSSGSKLPPQGPQITPQGPQPADHVPERTGRILRPLLAIRRADLMDFLESRNQSWRTDSTNADDAFTRNRIRHCVLPLLREFNPAIDQALANLAELAREDEARWQTELGRILPQLLLPGRPGARRGPRRQHRARRIRRWLRFP